MKIIFSFVILFLFANGCSEVRSLSTSKSVQVYAFNSSKIISEWMSDGGCEEPCQGAPTRVIDELRRYYVGVTQRNWIIKGMWIPQFSYYNGDVVVIVNAVCGDEEYWAIAMFDNDGSLFSPKIVEKPLECAFAQMINIADQIVSDGLSH